MDHTVYELQHSKRCGAISLWIYQISESTEVVLLRLAAAGGDGEAATAARGGSISQDQGLGIVIESLFFLITTTVLRCP